MSRSPFLAAATIAIFCNFVTNAVLLTQLSNNDKLLPRDTFTNYSLTSTYYRMFALEQQHDFQSSSSVSAARQLPHLSATPDGIEPHVRSLKDYPNPGPALSLFRLGTVWPKPQLQTSTSTVLKLSASFTFQHVDDNSACMLIDEAVRRYEKLILRQQRVFGPIIPTDNVGNLFNISLQLATPCNDTEYPTADMDEHYVIKIDPNFESYISAVSQWGLLRGLESFTQLTYTTADGVLIVNETLVNDWPRFAHRGLMVDTARHFISLNLLKKNLDAMAYNKLNVFHWHIVDDQSFPFESERFPNMSTLGAFPPTALHQYSTGQVRAVIDYARMRGIRVMPEFDTPGHTESWGVAMPEILTQCYDKNNQPILGQLGPFDPTKEILYRFLAQLFVEIFERFPDTYVHLGGDEVEFACWKSNPAIRQWMQAKNFGDDYAKLQSFYQTRLLKTLNAVKSPTQHEFVVWQEVFDNGAPLDNQTIVHVWYVDERWHEKMADITRAGLKALLSSCWYLNLIRYGEDWVDYYKCDPHNFNGTDAQKRLVVGGEATMWAEYVDGTNLLQRTWPRAAAVAERLWSNITTTQDIGDARLRLRTQRCRMIERGLPVEPITWAVYGPDYCPVEYGTFDGDETPSSKR